MPIFWPAVVVGAYIARAIPLSVPEFTIGLTLFMCMPCTISSGAGQHLPIMLCGCGAPRRVPGDITGRRWSSQDETSGGSWAQRPDAPYLTTRTDMRPSTDHGGLSLWIWVCLCLSLLCFQGLPCRRAATSRSR